MTHIITDSSEFDIRYTVAEDSDFLEEWLSFPGMLHYFTMEDPEEVVEMIRIWMGFVRFKSSITATYKGKPCGIATIVLMPYIKLIHQSMAYIIVDPLMQKQGVGTALIRNLDHLAQNYFRLERMHYEVYGDTSLIRILRKLGYEELFKQERYLKEDETYIPRIVLEKVFKKI